MRRPYASKLIFALVATAVLIGCSERVALDVLSETEDPVYRRAKDLLARNLETEALSNFSKLITMRDGNAPESHLEAGLIYLNHRNDPISAIYHFKRFQAIKGRDPESAERDASIARVEDLVKTAKKEWITTTDAQEYRLKLLGTIEQLRSENETLKNQLREYRRQERGAFLENPTSDDTILEPVARAEPRRDQPNPPPAQRRVYVVKERDSLYKISREMYGNPNRWREILEANRNVLPSESDLQPGMSLIIP